MVKVRYGDLNQQQKNHICNGCGPKGGWFNPPGWIFTASCDHHDFNYTIGNTNSDRYKADTQFYEAMKVDAGNLKSKRRFAYFVAWFYYKAVRLMGWISAFNYEDLLTLDLIIEEFKTYNIPCDNLNILLKERENDNST